MPLSENIATVPSLPYEMNKCAPCLYITNVYEANPDVIAKFIKCWKPKNSLYVDK